MAAISSPVTRAAFINQLLGRRYEAGAMGLAAFDCYGLARYLQAQLFGRDLPMFQLPGEASRFAVASAIAVHPERNRWHRIERAEDGALVVMARQDCGFHLGTFLALDRGLVVHTIEQTGVVAESPWQLASPAARWRLEYYLPEGRP